MKITPPKFAGIVILMSVLLFWRSERSERPVIPENLRALLKQADRILVKDAPCDDAEQLFESSKRADIEALSAAIDVDIPSEFIRIACDGSPTIYVYQGDELLAMISNYGGRMVRCSLWDSDAFISDPESWIAWFDNRQINGPRIEYERGEARRKQDEKNWKKWVAGMPNEFDHIWKDPIRELHNIKSSVLESAFKTSFRTDQDRILALLSWYGSGVESWSPYPSYETSIEGMLLKYDVAKIVSAIDLDQMSSSQLEGAARLFSDWSFGVTYPDGLQRIPDSLKDALWDHVKNSEYEEKRIRAQEAFQPK